MAVNAGKDMPVTTLADLRPDEANRRRHTPRNVGMIVNALHEVGAARSIVIDEQGTILAGNATVEAAAEAGIERVQVVDADGETIVAVRRTGLTEEQKRRLALYDNRAAELAEWDTEQIAADLEAGLNFDGLFTGEEIREITSRATREVPEDPGAQIDKAEELQEKWQTARGQIWEIPSLAVSGGIHRIMCGDATSADDVDRLVGANRLEMCFTSPPYNAGVSAQLSGNTSIGDNLYRDAYNDNRPESEWLAMLLAFTAYARRVSQFTFVNLQMLAGNKHALVEYLYRCRDSLADVAVWDKGHAAPQQAQRVMDSQFEFVVILSDTGTRAIGTRNFRGMVPNVYSGNPQRHNEFASSHAATFPIDFPSHFIETFTNAGERVLDPFLGSGTTMVAAEQLGRVCYGIEIEPRYTAVCLERMANMGLTPTLIESGAKP